MVTSRFDDNHFGFGPSSTTVSVLFSFDFFFQNAHSTDGNGTN